MVILDRHHGDFGISAWVDCRQCIHNQAQGGWFAIKRGEAHYVDRQTNQHFHNDCAAAMVEAGHAVYAKAVSQRPQVA